MTVHFDLPHDGWRTSDARIFANALRQAPALVRDKICRQFGFTLAFDLEGIRVDYDGRKVGFGSFCNDCDRITFAVSPKIEDFDIKALFKCIDSLHLFNKIVQFDNNQQADVHEQQDESFSWVFLLGLLDDINNFGIHNFLIFNSKKVLKGRSAIVGRPIAKSLVMNVALGRFGVDCEVLDNFRQRQYASLFFHTAQSIYKDLSNWQSIIKRSDSNLTNTFHSIAAKLKHFSDIPLSQNLLRELSHPPFTYGVKDLLMKCIRYWKWKGIVATSNSRSNNAFWSVSIALDQAFELYAGHVIGKMLKQSTKIQKQRYSFTFPIKDLRFPKDRVEREIEPDHIYVIDENALVIIAEIKYSNQLAVREHVGQLISYLKYSDFPFLFKDRIGLLVYPGQSLLLQPIPNFEANIFLLTLPANEEFVTNVPDLDLERLLA